MHNIPKLLNALKRLNDLQVSPHAPWTMNLSPGECSVLVERLRKTLPTALLGHHDRMVARGRRSLASVLDGVCGACRLRLPRGHNHPAAAGLDLDVCDNCGVFLEWPSPVNPPAMPVGAPTKPGAHARNKVADSAR